MVAWVCSGNRGAMMGSHKVRTREICPSCGWSVAVRGGKFVRHAHYGRCPEASTNICPNSGSNVAPTVERADRG